MSTPTDTCSPYKLRLAPSKWLSLKFILLVNLPPAYISVEQAQKDISVNHVLLSLLIFFVSLIIVRILRKRSDPIFSAQENSFEFFDVFSFFGRKTVPYHEVHLIKIDKNQVLTFYVKTSRSGLNMNLGSLSIADRIALRQYLGDWCARNEVEFLDELPD